MGGAEKAVLHQRLTPLGVKSGLQTIDPDAKKNKGLMMAAHQRTIDQTGKYP
jgi:hypothetical protein